jgi:hypothetical protein
MIYYETQWDEEMNEVECFWPGDVGRSAPVRLQVHDSGFPETLRLVSDLVTFMSKILRAIFLDLASLLSVSSVKRSTGQWLHLQWWRARDGL